MSEFSSLYALQPQTGQRLRHEFGWLYTYEGVNFAGQHFGRGEDGILYALTEGQFWKREATE
ncbi:hypothetical protein CLG85_001555 [Yangia mangrovi]|uniref:Uncharacterized protein n=1 Tax=Alloyangia mangrovi TaxID=1779329 RepID=A0A2A3K0X5_9RHOB|nr:hypothetical protein [Alloyangia mangrovi]MCT4369095.1 hypothetical protein [Alloyangia mangrovi]